MRNTLKSISWADTAKKIRECHLTLLDKQNEVAKWNEAFNALIESIRDERKYNPVFATEVCYLTPDTGFIYDIKDILEEYFDYLEENKAWDSVIKSCNVLLDTFAWNNYAPSEYKYRIGNALQKEGKLKEAEEFGKKWMKENPNDLFAAASNSFLLVSLGRTHEAKEIASRFLSPDLVCDDDTVTVFMAAERLYEITEDKNAKQRISEKIAEYNKMTDKF